MIEGDSEEYDLFEKWTKDFDCQGYYSCEIGVRKGYSSKIAMDNLKNNFLHIGVDPYGDRQYQHFDKDSGIKHLDGISPTYPNTMRDEMLQDFKWYLNAGKFRFHNMTDTDFMKHPAYNDSKFAFVMLDGPHTTKDVLTEAIWFANKSAPRCRIVFDDWITYKMDLIKNVMKEYDFEVVESGRLKLLMEKNGN
jgi:hypothetical protein|tara:strand:- start:99 stop:677 length:579 start_codon:yes stop_codon:yes gene_type:complete